MQRDDGSLWLADRHHQPITAYHIPQGDTKDCGPHVVTMAINFARGERILGAAEVASAMNRPRLRVGLPPILIRRVPNWATFPWGIADVLCEHGLDVSWRLRASEDDIHTALRDDRLVMPIFGQPFRRRGLKWTGWSHVALLVGWNPDSDAYVFVDSARRSTVSHRSRAEFMDLWRNMARILITAR